MTKDELIELAQVGMGIHSPNAPEYIVCEALIKALAQQNQTTNYSENYSAQPEQEPLKYTVNVKCGRCGSAETYDLTIDTTPPQRKPLTDEGLRELADKHLFYQPEGYEVSGVFVLARAIEAAHGIKGDV